MGGCGCICNEKAVLKVKAPKGYYLLNTYPGCSYCSAPAGVSIIKVDKTDLIHYEADDMETTEITELGRGIPIFGVEELRRELFKAMAVDIGTKWEDNIELEVFLEEIIDDSFIYNCLVKMNEQL